MPGFDVGFKSIYSCGADESEGTISSGYKGAPKSSLRHTVETARKNRFELSVNATMIRTSSGTVNFPMDISLACMSIDRPTLRVQKERVWNGADYINVPLRGEYDPIQAVLYEVLRDGSTKGKAIANWTMESVLSWWTNSSFNFQHSRTAFRDARRATVVIKQLNGAGDPIWAYRLHNCWPEIVSPDSLSYKSSDIATTAVTLSFDKVEEAINF